jgi:exopolysaccharide biosynthesis polyprenyl glycosylphosphotransferase
MELNFLPALPLRIVSAAVPRIEAARDVPTAEEIARALYAPAKRGFDILFSLTLLIVLLPLLLTIALAITATSPGPVLFRQTRLGRGGKPFTFLKFRSMVHDAETLKTHVASLNEASGPVFKARNDPRVTTIGRWLRKTSLDELPQLVNILRGEMSLVGPRPPLPDEVAKYTPGQRRRLDVEQGLTGLWQVKGRSDVTDFEHWVALDLEYIQRRGFWFDLALVVQTVPVVLLGKGAY